MADTPKEGVSVSYNEGEGIVLVRFMRDGDRKRTNWRFKIDRFTVWLDGFWTQERKTTADRWTETITYSSANGPSGTIDAKDVPMPGWVWGVAVDAITAKLELKRHVITDQVKAGLKVSREKSKAIKRQKV
jgi:hypothetical protein